MKPRTFEELYLDQLRDLYDAESQLVKALPRMAEAARTPDLKEGFEEHLEQTRQHMERLKELFKKRHQKPTGKSCKGMEGLIEEGEEVIKETKDADPWVIDAGLIAAAQKVEHYEIAGYGTCRTFAECLGLEEEAAVLQATLDEEGETDKKLTEIAEDINVEAVEETEEPEEVNVEERPGGKTI